jgi:hypothetical protein
MLNLQALVKNDKSNTKKYRLTKVSIKAMVVGAIFLTLTISLKISILAPPLVEKTSRRSI